MTSHILTAGAKALSCAVVLVGLAVPAASAFTLIELIGTPTNPAPPPGGVPAGPSSVATEQKGPQPIGLLLPAVQKVREGARDCPSGQVAAPNGQGCTASGLATVPAAR